MERTIALTLGWLVVTAPLWLPAGAGAYWLYRRRVSRWSVAVLLVAEVLAIGTSAYALSAYYKMMHDWGRAMHPDQYVP